MSRKKIIWGTGTAVVVILLLVAICCPKNDKNDIQEDAVVLEDAEMELPETEQTEYYNLSAQGALESDVVSEDEEIYMLSDVLKTNSTEIAVHNKADISIKVYLYNMYDLDTPIQEMNVDSLAAGTFTNLSASYLYKIGVASSEAAQLQIVISDK